jgi:WD40 repeat protein
VEWYIWDVDGRRLIAKVPDGHPTNCCDFSPDGHSVLVGTKDKTLRCIDLDSGDVFDELGRGWQVWYARVHPGGRLIAFSSDRTYRVHVLDREGGHVIRSLSSLQENGNGRFHEVAWHPGGKILAAANEDHLVYLWDAETGERTRILQGHNAEIIGMGFSPTGSVLVSSGWDPALQFWDPASDRPIFSLYNRNIFNFLSNGARCWTASDGRGELWEFAKPAAFTLFGHDRMNRDAETTKHPYTIALAPGGGFAASGGEDGVRLWDLSSRSEVGHLDVGLARGVVFDRSGKSLYTSSAFGLYQWPLRPIGDGGTRIAIGPARRLSQSDQWQRADLDLSGRKLLAVHSHDHAHLITPEDPERKIELRGPAADWFVALSPDGAWAAAGSFRGNEVWIWDIRGSETGQPPKPVQKIKAWRARLRFHPAGSHLGVCTPEEFALWKVGASAPDWRIEREHGLTFSGSIAFDPDGKLVAVTYNDLRIWLLETATGRKLCELEGPEKLQLTDLAMEGGRIAASTLGRQIHVWDLNGLALQICDLGLHWEIPTGGTLLKDLPPLRAEVVEPSVDTLRGEVDDLSARQLLRPTLNVAFQPQLASFVQIDRALATPHLFIAEGDEWKYFRGRSEPSPGTEWTGIDFDDGPWEEGQSRLTGWPNRMRTDGTYLADQLGSYTTLYARRAFTVDEPTEFSRVVFAAEIEDGLVAYLNGEEIARVNAGARGEQLSAKSFSQHKERRLMIEAFEIPPASLRVGRNVPRRDGSG